MTAGLSAVNLANAWLNTIRNTSAASFTAPTDIFIQCHTADPGASGTTAVSTGIATRTVADWAAASAGSMALTATVSFAATGSDTITHIAAFSASTAGTFYWSAALSASKAVTNGDTLNLTTCTIALTPIAAQMDAAGITTRLRRLDESTMVDACTVKRLTGTTTDNDGNITPTFSTIFTGPCRVVRGGTLGAEAAAAGAVVVEARDTVNVPITAVGIEVDDVITITASQLDPDLVGRYWRIAQPSRATYLTSRQFAIEEDV